MIGNMYIVKFMLPNISIKMVTCMHGVVVVVVVVVVLLLQNISV